MKYYKKLIGNNTIIKPKNRIIIVKDGLQTINPKEELLLLDGWELYQPSEEELLNTSKEYKIKEIHNYDSSKDVNSFYVGESELWLDKATRVGLKLRFEAEIDSGKTDTILWYEGNQFPLTLENALTMLNAIELYASACYDNTQKHIAMVKLLTTVDEVKNYDHREGYPDKLRF